MNCLNFRKRLLPAGRVWKVLTAKLQNKLRKPQRLKAMSKKPKNQLIINKTVLIRTPLSLRIRLQPKRRRHTFKPTRNTLRAYNHSSRLQERPAPIFVDELFTEKPVSVVKEQDYKTKLTDKPETSKNKEHDTQSSNTADDMWESLVLTSPQMDGIDERAEEFITRFRAEMQLQEMLARGL